MTLGKIETIINNNKRYVDYSIHSWGNKKRISLILSSVDSSFLRPEDLEQIANDLKEKEKEIENNAKIPKVGEKVTFSGQFNGGMIKYPLNKFEDGDTLECIAIKKNDDGDDMAVFWNIDKKLASGLIKEIGGNINYRRW